MKKKFNNEIEKLQLINEQKSKNNDSLKSANDVSFQYKKIPM